MAMLCSTVAAETKPARPTLWVLSVGVSRYADAAFRLNFADSDATAVADTLKEQAGRRVYGDVQTRVLTDEQATRESILTGIRDFIARAGPSDVATIFLAGHGVRDLLTGTYYFLPQPATRENFFTRGLRVEELNDMVRILQRHVRHVVIILDTCHAGAMKVPSTPVMIAAEDFQSQVRAEGVFLLAATRPGDKSKEIPRLQHGVFTYALLRALQGEANAGADGLLSLAELVIYLGVEVPRLTQNQQTPYYLIAGTDLVFADVRQPNSIAVLGFNNEGPRVAGSDWMGRSLQEGIYFALGTIPVLHRCALQPVDHGGEPPKSAQELGCSKYVTGSYAIEGDQIELRARVVDTATDADEVTATVRGKRADFGQLRDQLVRDIVTRMPLVRAYLLMLESQGVDPESLPLTLPTPGPHSRLWDLFVTRADAQSLPAAASQTIEQKVRQLLDEYREAHEEKQIDRLAALWANFSPRQREATRRYFDQAGNLTLELNDVVIEPYESEITVAFTRVERFVDRESGKPVRLQIPQRMILTRTGDEVKITRIESR